MIISEQGAENYGKIIRAKPEIKIKIIDKLINIDESDQEHKDLTKAGIIEGFDKYSEEAENRKKILEFVQNQLNCRSPKMRKKGKEFLKEWKN